MKKILFSLTVFIVLLTSITLSMEVQELFNRAKEVNSNYILSELALEKATMEYDKSMIEASNRKSELSAETAFLNGKSSADKYVKSFYTEIIGAVFSIKSSEKALDIAKLNYENSNIDYEKNEGLFKKALLSKQDLDDSRIDLDDKLNSLNKAQQDFDNLIDDFKRYTGIEWSQASDTSIEIPDYRKYLVNEDTWFAKSLSLGSSRKNLESAEYEVENLYSNSSEYAKRSAEINRKQKEIELEMSEITLRNDKRTSEQSLEYSRKQLENLAGKLEIEKDIFKDTQDRYEKELVSKQQFYQQKISFLNSEKQLIDAQKSYWNSLTGYLMSIGRTPEDVLVEEVSKE